MKKTVKTSEKVSFFPKGKFRLRDIPKEKKELEKKFKISRFSLFMMAILLSTSIIYYSAIMLEYIGFATKYIIIMLAPVWVVVSIFVFVLITGKKVEKKITEKLE